jgi:hypothetical protein
MTSPSVALADCAGQTMRGILASEVDKNPAHVTEFLRSGDPIDRLTSAVAAIESSAEVTKSEDSGTILFVSPAYRYRLTQTAFDLL